MKFRCEIDMDNAAFDNPGLELRRIHRQIADQIENTDIEDGAEQVLRDHNGNRVGRWWIEGERE